MKDNYSWLDQSLRAIIDYKDPEIAIVEVKSRVAKQFEIEKLRARIKQLKTLVNLDRYTNRDSYASKTISDLQLKLKELKGKDE